MRGQNRSSAVMQQRAQAPDSLDFFPTPPWATRALCERIPSAGYLAWDPCCGEGHMVRPLQEYFLAVAGSDVHDYGQGYEVHDFLMPFEPDGTVESEWVITNPPFAIADQIVLRALQVATHGVAMFVRTAFLEAETRHTSLFERHPPAMILQFVERVVLHKGILRQPGVRYFDDATGDWKTPSTATAYCWVIWSTGARPPHTRFEWIPPCRKRLERPGDYAPIAPPPAAGAPLFDALAEGA